MSDSCQYINATIDDLIEDYRMALIAYHAAHENGCADDNDRRRISDAENAIRTRVAADQQLTESLP